MSPDGFASIVKILKPVLDDIHMEWRLLVLNKCKHNSSLTEKAPLLEFPLSQSPSPPQPPPPLPPFPNVPLNVNIQPHYSAIGLSLQLPEQRQQGNMMKQLMDKLKERQKPLEK